MNAERFVEFLAPITLFEMMVAIGLGATFAEIGGVARNRRLVVKAAFANYVVYPAVAVGLLLVFHADPWVAAGFVIAAVCPGAPFGPPLTGLARGNVPVAVGLMVLLAGSSAVVAPALLRLLLPVVSGGAGLAVDTGKLLVTLGITQFLPLCVGLGVRHRFPNLAARLKTPASRLSGVLNAVLLTCLLVAQYDMLAAIPARAYFRMSLLVAAGVATGWLAGGPGGDTRTATAIATGVRNVGVSLVIATASFPGTLAVSAATVFAIFQTVGVALLAACWGRLRRSPESFDATQDDSDESLLRGSVRT